MLKSTVVVLFDICAPILGDKKTNFSLNCSLNRPTYIPESWKY